LAVVASQDEILLLLIMQERHVSLPRRTYKAKLGKKKGGDIRMTTIFDYTKQRCVL